MRWRKFCQNGTFKRKTIVWWKEHFENVLTEELLGPMFFSIPVPKEAQGVQKAQGGTEEHFKDILASYSHASAVAEIR